MQIVVCLKKMKLKYQIKGFSCSSKTGIKTPSQITFFFLPDPINVTVLLETVNQIRHPRNSYVRKSVLYKTLQTTYLENSGELGPKGSTEEPRAI